MSLNETTRPQRPAAEDHVATVTEPLPAKGHIGERGYSDSVVPSCRLSATKQLQMSEGGEHILKPLPTSQLDGASGRGAISLSERVRAARNLCLPSFTSLGIAVPHPSALLTPPEDGLCAGLPLSPSSLAPLPPISPLGHPRSSSFPQSNAPRTPELFEMSVSSATFGSSSVIPQASAAQHQVQDSILPSQLSMTTMPAIEVVDTTVEPVSWVAEAVDLVVVNVPNTTPRVVNVMCQTQPCPPSDEDAGTTGFKDLMIMLQGQIDSEHQYIEVTHVIPLRFNMAQIPQSPSVTPNSQAPSPPDYFSLNCFPKAVVAHDYQHALESPTPSSPHPVVAPHTVSVSLLERFIPPPSVHEYADLFSTDGPSVLVNRLWELSPQGGRLIFIYPTAVGASAFRSAYLSPVLDPLLRTMAGVYNLTMEIAEHVNQATVVEKMSSYDQMVRKITTLLRKMNRSPSTMSRTKPAFTLLKSSKQVVDIERQTWTEWWLNQEENRIKGIVDRYFARGIRLPTVEYLTAGALRREIYDGVRTRDYAEYGPAREGIEVGMFVFQRTA